LPSDLNVTGLAFNGLQWALTGTYSSSGNNYVVRGVSAGIPISSSWTITSPDVIHGDITKLIWSGRLWIETTGSSDIETWDPTYVYSSSPDGLTWTVFSDDPENTSALGLVSLNNRSSSIVVNLTDIPKYKTFVISDYINTFTIVKNSFSYGSTDFWFIIKLNNNDENHTITIQYYNGSTTTVISNTSGSGILPIPPFVDNTIIAHWNGTNLDFY
jgi:hypothetical protein